MFFNPVSKTKNMNITITIKFSQSQFYLYLSTDLNKGNKVNSKIK